MAYLKLGLIRDDCNPVFTRGIAGSSIDDSKGEVFEWNGFDVVNGKYS